MSKQKSRSRQITAPNHRSPSKLSNRKIQPNQPNELNLSVLRNHPSGDPKPSREDIEMTKEIRKAAEALGITIHDHLVIGRRGHASFEASDCRDNALDAGRRLVSNATKRRRFAAHRYRGTAGLDP